jgi:hypothetical protein
MKQFIQDIIQYMRIKFYFIRNDKLTFVVNTSLIILIFCPILIFLYYHQQDLIDIFFYALNKVKNLFIAPPEVIVEKEPEIIEEPKPPVSGTSSTKKIIWGITVTVATGVVYIIIEIIKSSGGWGGP